MATKSRSTSPEGWMAMAFIICSIAAPLAAMNGSSSAPPVRRTAESPAARVQPTTAAARLMAKKSPLVQVIVVSPVISGFGAAPGPRIRASRSSCARHAYARSITQIVGGIDHHHAAVREPTRNLDPAAEIAADGHRLVVRRRIGRDGHDLRWAVAYHQGRGGDAQRGRTDAERELHLRVHPRQENARGIRHAHLREQRPGRGVE